MVQLEAISYYPVGCHLEEETDLPLLQPPFR